MPQYDWNQIKKKFSGIKNHGNVKSGFNAAAGATDSDQTKQLGDSGKAYLSNEAFEKNRNSDETWKLYEEVYGAEAAAAKREGNEEGLSINAYDGLMDKAYGGKNASSNEEEEKVVLSPEMQQAKDRVQQWESKAWSGEQSAEIFGSSKNAADDPVNQTSSAEDQTNQAAKAFIQRDRRDAAQLLNNKITI